jgi:hypothetical protein
MRVGISLTCNHPDVKDPRQGARWMIERAAASRRAALDYLFVGDQRVSATPYYQNTPMLGRLLNVTPAWIGGGVSIEPRSEAMSFSWHWRDLRTQAMRAAQLVALSKPNAAFCA